MASALIASQEVALGMRVFSASRSEFLVEAHERGVLFGDVALSPFRQAYADASGRRFFCALTLCLRLLISGSRSGVRASRRTFSGMVRFGAWSMMS